MTTDVGKPAHRNQVGKPARRNQVGLAASLTLLAVSLIATVVMHLYNVPVLAPNAIPWALAITATIVVLRVVWSRPGVTERQSLLLFWVNIALGGAAIWVSPVYGLYLFVNYYEAGRFTNRVQQIAGLVATALLIALSQVGGPRSDIFIPLIYWAFVAVNLGITGLMFALDRQREGLFVEITRAYDELRREQERSARFREQVLDQAREAGIAEERARLSREIHDTVAQDLVAIIAQLDAATSATDPKERSRRLGLVDSAAREALAEARRAVDALASPRLDDADLPLALDDLLGGWRAATGLDGELTVEGRAASSDHDETLLRIAQEALANVARHAEAHRTDVGLRYGAGIVTLTIADDGVGFGPSAEAAGGGGYGIAGMRARVKAAGGSLDVESVAGAGTRVTASIPLDGRAG